MDVLNGLSAYLRDPNLFAALLLAVPFGLVAGAVPGLGGKLSIVMALPFLIGQDPMLAAVFLLAMHSVIHTGGPVPSILIGIPGTGPDAATVLDGHPMARRGEAGRALGAALAASCVGGLFGALCLAFTLPFASQMIRAFGPPEIFLLTLLGISFISSVSGNAVRRGLIIGCLGLLTAFVGMDPISGVARFTFNQYFLWDGVDLISAIIGLFAIPEMLALLTARRSLGGTAPGSSQTTGVWTGMLDVWRHRYLTLRASLIGTLIGTIPGLGGEVASWLAYGHAVQSSPRPEEFGTGRVEGVIAPEAANNSKEGGSLLPTLFFGLPGSSGMAVMLGAFITLGITPGISLATPGTNLIWILIWALVLANILSVAIFLGGSRWLLRFVDFPGHNIFPFVLTFALMGSYFSALNWQTWLLVLAFGILGHLFKINNWPRAPFAIGLVLGSTAEIALHQSTTIWGASFLLRPVSLVLIALIIATLYFNLGRLRGHTDNTGSGNLGLPGLLALLFAGALVLTSRYPSVAAVFPAGVAMVGLALALAETFSGWRTQVHVSTTEHSNPERKAIFWLAAFVASAVLFGLSPGLPLLTAIYFHLRPQASRWTPLISATVLFLILEGVMARGLGLDVFPGLVDAWIS